MHSLTRIFLYLLSLLTSVYSQSSSSSVSSLNSTSSGSTTNGTPVSSSNSSNQTATSTSPSASTSPYPSLGDVSPCVSDCLQFSVAQANCSTITDVGCYCSSAIYRNTTLNCVSTQCPNELASTEALAQQFCNIASVSLMFPPQTLSGSATISPTFPATSSSSSIPSPATSTSPPGNSAGSATDLSIFTAFLCILIAVLQP